MQDRYGNGAVGQRGEEGDTPSGGVLSADGNLVSMLHARGLKDDVKFFYNTSDVLILERVCSIVGEGIVVPKLLNAVAKTGIERGAIH